MKRAGSDTVGPSTARVFISRTSDMACYPKESSFVEAAVEAINRAGMVPVDMKYFAARDDKPASYCQERVRSCDIYVILAGFRYGSIVPQMDISYTELEFTTASAAQLQRLVFLLDEDAPYPPRLVDVDRATIDAFRRRICNSELIVIRFESVKDLEFKIFQALTEVRMVDDVPEAMWGCSSSSFASQCGYYFRRLLERYRQLDLTALTPVEQEEHLPMLLRSVFVPQHVRTDPPPIELPKELWRRLVGTGELSEYELPKGVDMARIVHAQATYRERPTQPVLEVLTDPSQRLVVLLGDPGAGKSTLARYVTVTLAGENPDVLTPLAGRMPILIELRTYADPQWRTGRWADGTFLDLVDYLHTNEGLGLPKDVLASYLSSDGRAVVIFDGLDELFDPKTRETVTRQIAAFVARYPNVRIVVTSRVIGYQRAVLDAAGFFHYTLQDLDEQQIERFVRIWYGLACNANPVEAAQRCNRLLDAIKESTSVQELAGNPLLLTILSIIGRRQELPRERRAVYSHAASVLVEHWDVNRHLRDMHADTPYIDREDKLELLQRVARKMQAKREGLAGNHIAASDLLIEFNTYLYERYRLSPDKSKQVAKAMLSQFRERNFILSRFGGKSMDSCTGRF